MYAMARSLRILVVLLAVALPALLPAAHHSARAAVSTGLAGPRAYYLALGDSLAFGFQPNLTNGAGYVPAFFAHLQTLGTQAVADMGCTGETTITFINGGCRDGTLLPPHYRYSGPQLSAALQYIKAHPGQVSPVTIDIGADDFSIDQATCAVSAFTTTLQTVQANYTAILGQLKTALGGTGDLIAMTYYDPYQNMCPNLLPQFETLNAALAAIARANGALIAPVFGAFGGAAVPNPHLCSYTWICQVTTYLPCRLDAKVCIHPTTLGYGVMARTIQATYGY
jgi:lysophospholipase L1-like esterase